MSTRRAGAFSAACDTLAEKEDEREFLEHSLRVFRELWEADGTWAEPVADASCGPIEFAAAIGLLDYPALLAHVHYCSDADLDLLARGGRVSSMPADARVFRSSSPAGAEMLARGITSLSAGQLRSSPN